MFTFLLLSVLGGGAWCFVVHRVTVCTNLMCVCVCVFESIIFIIWSVLFLDYKVKFKKSPHSYLKVSFVYVELQKSFVTKLHKSAWTHFGGILPFFFSSSSGLNVSSKIYHVLAQTFLGIFSFLSIFTCFSKLLCSVERVRSNKHGWYWMP